MMLHEENDHGLRPANMRNKRVESADNSSHTSEDLELDRQVVTHQPMVPWQAEQIVSTLDVPMEFCERLSLFR